MVAPSYDPGLLAWLWVVPWIGAVAVGPAHAEDASHRCGESLRPWVELQFAGTGWEPRLQRTIRADLAAGLRLRGLLVCAPDRPGPEPPLATVQLSAASVTKVAVEIEVHDALTNKYVVREVDIRNVTADARGLTLAAAAEELLRASWAELALEDAPPPAREPPPEVTAAVRPAAPQGAERYTLGARATAEHYGGGHTQYGPEVFLDVWFAERLAAELSIGYRRGLEVSSDHGTIQSEAASFGLEALYALGDRSSRLLVLGRAGAQLASLEYQGRAGARGVGRERRGVHVAVRAALVVRWAIGRGAELRGEAGPGYSVRALSALDGDEEVTAIGGIHAHAGLGFGAVF